MHVRMVSPFVQLLPKPCMLILLVVLNGLQTLVAFIKGLRSIYYSSTFVLGTNHNVDEKAYVGDGTTLVCDIVITTEENNVI